MGDATPTSNRDLSSRSAVPEAGQFGADTPADVGDAGSMYDNVVGGSDRLVSGTGSADYMWGDAVYKDAAAVGLTRAAPGTPGPCPEGCDAP